tara:strand:- start:504 stop:965 length:462 start_codon:yes stop_codon:yes gene_type:complete
MEIDAWHLWLLAGIVLAALEMLGLAFVALALALSCVAGAAAALAGGSLTMQIAASAVAAIILTPLLVRLFKHRQASDGGVSLAGEVASLGQKYSLIEQQGRLGILIKGDFFPAQADNDEALSNGQAVIVQRFSGITAMVTPASANVQPKDEYR